MKTAMLKSARCFTVVPALLKRRVFTPTFEELVSTLLEERVINDSAAVARLLQKILDGCYSKNISLPPDLRGNDLAELSLLPWSDIQAQYLYVAREIIRRRLESGWYAAKLVFLNTQEISGSAAIESILRDLLQESGGIDLSFMPDFGAAGPLAIAGHASIPLAALLNIPNGGVVRGQYAAHNSNHRLIHSCQASLVTLLRHPADILAENSLSYTSLIDILHWMSSWISRSKTERKFCFIRYEDMEKDFPRTMHMLHHWLYERTAPDKLIHQAWHQWRQVNPRGTGLWKTQFNRAIVNKYNHIIEHYAYICPNMDDLFHYYPDLLLDPSELHTEIQAQ